MVQKAESTHCVPRPDAFLTAIQSRILLSMYLLDRPLYTKEILDFVEIPQSTWSSVALSFSKGGLIAKKQKREIDRGRIKSYTVFSLTDRGISVAKNLVAIYRKLSESEIGSLNEDYLEDTDIYSGSANESLDEKILDCIETGLNSFGRHTKDHVRIEVALVGNLSWSALPQKVQVLSDCLSERFGPKGAATIEAAIIQELEKRFNVTLISPSGSRNLASSVDALKSIILERKADLN
jgi:DNA-binding MarR family transcriptional regulator